MGRKETKGRRWRRSDRLHGGTLGDRCGVKPGDQERHQLANDDVRIVCVASAARDAMQTMVSGIGFGDELEYVDELTITHALLNRREVE